MIWRRRHVARRRHRQCRQQLSITPTTSNCSLATCRSTSPTKISSSSLNVSRHTCHTVGRSHFIPNQHSIVHALCILDSVSEMPIFGFFLGDFSVGVEFYKLFGCIIKVHLDRTLCESMNGIRPVTSENSV